MKKAFFAILVLGVALLLDKTNETTSKNEQVLAVEAKPSFWFELHRNSNKEFLYLGTPGEIDNSELVKVFDVKSGIKGKKPTPLPAKLGRQYWLITAKRESKENHETAPYFLTLDIPISDSVPFGPVPYEECEGQCNWELPGEFGLHGVGGDSSKLSAEDEGSSGCIRHSDSDITYLYNLLDPQNGQIRYYIKDL